MATWTTLKKELASYFFNPVAYVIAVLFYLFRGWEVYARTQGLVAQHVDLDLFSTTYIFNLSSNFMIVLVPPILTMRTFAEERRSGSLEVLMTAPVRDVEVVLGKWLAAVVFFALLWLPTLFVLWLLTLPSFMDVALPFGPVLTGYLGLSLLGGMLLAVGCFTSSLTDNVLLASLAALLFSTALLSVPSLLQPLVGRYAADHPWVATLHRQVDVYEHLQGWFGRGLIDTSQVVFYLGGTAFFLFLCIKALESRRWR